MDYKFHNNIVLGRGKLLISDPYKTGDLFERSVVYICEHDDKGSFGFIVNKPIQVKMKGIGAKFPDSIFTAFQGGPCDVDSLFFFHTLGNQIKDSLNMGQGLFLGTNYQELYNIVTPDLVEEGAIKIFIGYSGWSPGQLEQELLRNSWMVCPLEEGRDIMVSNDQLWEDLLTKMGHKYQIMSRFPRNPNDN